MKILGLGLLAMVLCSSCEPGVPIYDNNGKYWVRLEQDTLTCQRGETFFFLVDGAIVSDQSYPLPYVLLIDEGEHEVSVSCVPNKKTNWKMRLTITSDTVFAIPCAEHCRED